MTLVTFDVPGLPVGQGSKKAYVVGKGPLAGRKAVVVDTNQVPLDRYRSDIRSKAEAAMLVQGIPPTSTRVRASVFFTISRPPSHFTTKGALTKGAPRNPRSPDVDKAARSVLDALTDVVLVDDSQVWDLRAVKAYDDTRGNVSYTSVAVSW